MRTFEQLMVYDRDDRISCPNDLSGLSHKSLNMLRTILDRSHLGFVNMIEEDASPIKSRVHASSVARMIKEEAVKRNLPMDSVGPAFMKPLEPLISPNSFVGHKHPGLDEIILDDIPMFVRMLFDHRENPHHMQHTVVRTVFGATHSYYPLRALSYLVPALELVDSIRQSTMYPSLPQIQFFFMSYVGRNVNGLDSEIVDSATDEMIQVGEAFVDQFYPDLASYVVFCDDALFIQSGSVHIAHERLLKDGKIHDHGEFQRIIAKLHTSGKNGVENYALFHPLVHDITYPGEELFYDRFGRTVNNQPTVIINVGAQTEKSFYGIRKVCRDRLKDLGLHPVDILQYFTRHRTPPYLPMSDDGKGSNDISLKDAIADPSRVGNIICSLDRHQNLMRKDMDILTDGKLLDLVDFLRAYRAYHSNI